MNRWGITLHGIEQQYLAKHHHLSASCLCRRLKILWKQFHCDGHNKKSRFQRYRRLSLLLSCPPFTETLDVWPRLGTLQSPVICSHQIFLVALFPKIWTLEEVAHGLGRTTVAVYVLIFGITPLLHIDFAPTHPCAKSIKGLPHPPVLIVAYGQLLFGGER